MCNVNPVYLSAVAQSVSRWPFTSLARVRSRDNRCEFNGGKVALGKDFFQMLPFSPVSIITPLFHVFLPLHAVLTRTKVRSVGTFEKQYSLGGIWHKRSFTF
jgi:hypothetical protein